MIFTNRVRTVYCKELIDIMRDRRTLIAMIVVPIVLYPLLMLGSIQAVSYQVGTLAESGFIVGVVRDRDARALGDMIRRDADALKNERERRAQQAEADGKPLHTALEDLPTAIDADKVKVFDPPFESAAALKQAVQDRAVQVGFVLEEPKDRGSGAQMAVQLLADREEVRSANAQARIRDMLQRTSDRIKEDRLIREGLPPTYVDPFKLTSINLSAPSSILGQILPLILVLMTITGAIYPAIDLTAGERERNTLESLMVCPVPVLDLIVGKFLVVTTVAILGASLNLASVTATVYLGGFDAVIEEHGGALPLGSMLFILISLIPFAVLMSAIMIAVCSFARTFKEAQNYVTPVIIAVLIPGGIAAMPATELNGVMLVMPVGNMVLFAREMLLGTTVEWWKIVTVLLSTTLYASAAVAVAANIFGRETVVFSDSGSWNSLFSRKLMKPASHPSVSLTLLLVALLFPTWFFVQSALQPSGSGDDAALLWEGTLRYMPLFFLVLPVAVLAYGKVNLVAGLALRVPPLLSVLAAVLIGLSAWVPARELGILQNWLLPMPDAMAKSLVAYQEALFTLDPLVVVLAVAIVPAICEEATFRGLLMSGLERSSSKWTSIVVSAAVFGVFHFVLFKFPVTFGLGVVLGLLRWHARSIFPGMLMHMLHNGLIALSVIVPTWPARIGVDPKMTDGSHLPPHILIIGGLLFCLGLMLATRPNRQDAHNRRSPVPQVPSPVSGE